MQSLPTPPAFGAQLGVILSEFCKDLLHHKTKVPGLSCGIVCVIQSLAVFVNSNL